MSGVANRSRLLSTTLALAATLAPALAAAQDYAGTWRITRDEVDVTVAEWGSACGPGPASRRGATGREVTIRTEGSNLVIAGGRTHRTNRCWSDNPGVTLVSVQHPSPDRWIVACATPANAPLGEQGEYTLAAASENRLRFRDETRYTWTIHGANCRATSVLVREYERVRAAAQSPTPPTPTPPTPTPPRPTPPRRCATRGPATTLQVAPARRRIPASSRVCFQVRALDAARCAVPAGNVAWSVRRTEGRGDASLDGACLTAAANTPESAFEVTATAGALNARAVVSVVTEDRYRSLVAAHLEDPDAGADFAEPPPATGSQVGGITVETRGGEAPRGPRALVWALVAAAVALGLGGALLLARRRRPAPAPRPTEPLPDTPTIPAGTRSRHNAVALPEAVPVAPPPDTPRAGPPRRCPTCGAEHPAELAFCPNDGTRLAPGAAGSAAPARPAAQLALKCPRCGRVVSDGSKFCPEDGAVLEPASPAAAPAPTTTAPQADGVCPKCGRRYPAPTMFCGEDGATLVRTG